MVKTDALNLGSSDHRGVAEANCNVLEGGVKSYRKLLEAINMDAS